MSVVSHIRKGRIIQTLAQPEVCDKDGIVILRALDSSSEAFESINAAKRASRKLQKRRTDNGRPIVLRVASKSDTPARR